MPVPRNNARKTPKGNRFFKLSRGLLFGVDAELGVSEILVLMNKIFLVIPTAIGIIILFILNNNDFLWNVYAGVHYMVLVVIVNLDV